MSSTSAGQLQHGKAVLLDNYSYLANAIVPEDILPEMFARTLVTKSQKEKADSHSEKNCKNEVLLGSLIDRQEVGAFEKFCDVLSATSGQEYIADRLKECKLTCCYVPIRLLWLHKYITMTSFQGLLHVFVLWLSFSIIHRSRRAPALINEHKLTKNRGSLEMRLCYIKKMFCFVFNINACLFYCFSLFWLYTGFTQTCKDPSCTFCKMLDTKKPGKKKGERLKTRWSIHGPRLP